MMQLNVIHKCLTDAEINVSPNNLRTVVDFIADKHNLNVMVDNKDLEDLIEILILTDVKNGGRFVAYLTIIAVAHFSAQHKKVLTKSFIEGSDEFVRDEARKIMKRIAMKESNTFSRSWFGLFCRSNKE